MLRLIEADAAVTLIFAALYAGAGTRWMTQGAFLAGLVVFSVASIAFWVRVERTGAGGRDVITRIGRGSFALVVIVVGLPALVLAPLLGLQETLPRAAGFTDVVRPVMVLLLISLLWTVAVNLVGGAVLAGAGLWTALTRRSRAGS